MSLSKLFPDTIATPRDPNTVELLTPRLQKLAKKSKSNYDYESSFLMCLNTQSLQTLYTNRIKDEEIFRARYMETYGNVDISDTINRFLRGCTAPIFKYTEEQKEQMLGQAYEEQVSGEAFELDFTEM